MQQFTYPLTVNCVFIVRFLRHVPVIYVDYPGPTSLTQIYGTFNRAMLRIVPPLRSYAQPLTDAMVEFYSMSQVTMSLWSDFFFTRSHRPYWCPENNETAAILLYQVNTVVELFSFKTTKAILSRFLFATRVMSVKSPSFNNKPNWIGDLGDNEGNH